MARPLRIEYEGAWYHVMNRGAGRRPIFKNDDQRHYFLDLLAVVSERFSNGESCLLFDDKPLSFNVANT